MIAEIIRMTPSPENDLTHHLTRLSKHYSGWKPVSPLSLTKGLKAKLFTSLHPDPLCYQVLFSTFPSNMRPFVVCASGKQLRSLVCHLHTVKTDVSSFKVNSNFKSTNRWNYRHTPRNLGLFKMVSLQNKF